MITILAGVFAVAFFVAMALWDRTCQVSAESEPPDGAVLSCPSSSTLLAMPSTEADKYKIWTTTPAPTKATIGNSVVVVHFRQSGDIRSNTIDRVEINGGGDEWVLVRKSEWEAKP